MGKLAGGRRVLLWLLLGDKEFGECAIRVIASS